MPRISIVSCIYTKLVKYPKLYWCFYNENFNKKNYSETINEKHLTPFLSSQKLLNVTFLKVWLKPFSTSLPNNFEPKGNLNKYKINDNPSFEAQKIKRQHEINHLLSMNLCVLGCSAIYVGKLTEVYSKEMLNMLGMTKLVLLTSMLMNVMVFIIRSILPN